MAKWGEGDPRWLVEERPDATNVNNWHWTEKNAAKWSKEKFNELFIGAVIDEGIGTCEIVEITVCEGDAVVNNRKAKLIFFYEWKLEMKFKGYINGSAEVLGTIKVPSLSEEDDVNEVDVIMSVESTIPEAGYLEDKMNLFGITLIRRKLADYISALKEEFSKGLILPTKDSVQIETAQTDKLNKKNDELGSSVSNSVTIIHDIETVDLKSTENFKCTPGEFYRAMTVKELVMAFTQGDCVLESKLFGKFELFSGNVQGYFVNLDTDKKIGMKWRHKSWPKEHFSDVIIKIKQRLDSTDVEISQYGIPKSDFERTDQGWKTYYWDSMKRTFGFGAILF